MSNCPYCRGASLSPVTSERPRPEHQTVMECASCGAYSLDRAGTVFPLTDRTDKDADACTRVID